MGTWGMHDKRWGLEVCEGVFVPEQFDANSIQFCLPAGVEPYMWGVLRGMTDMWGVEELFRFVF
jgi:hypothetical protein